MKSNEIANSAKSKEFFVPGHDLRRTLCGPNINNGFGFRSSHSLKNVEFSLQSSPRFSMRITRNSIDKTLPYQHIGRHNTSGLQLCFEQENICSWEVPANSSITRDRHNSIAERTNLINENCVVLQKSSPSIVSTSAWRQHICSS